MKQRLVEFLAYLDIGQTKFEEKVGLPRGYVNKMTDNTRTTSLQKIADWYPELNMNWLKTGEGEMLRLSTQRIGDIDARCNRGFSGNMSGGNYTIHHDEGKDRLIEEQKNEVNKMFEAIIVAVSGFQKSSERHDEYIVRRDDYIKRQDDYIDRIINNSYLRNKENMERIDNLIQIMNEDRNSSREQLDRLIEQQNQLIQIIDRQNQKVQDRADRLLDLLEKKL